MSSSSSSPPINTNNNTNTTTNKKSTKLTSAPLGQPLPLDDHACSVSLPTWSSVVGYEEGDAHISKSLSCGYPRFVYHPYVLQLMNVALEINAKQKQQQQEKEGKKENNGNGGGDWDCLLLPSGKSAARCHDFLIRASSSSSFSTTTSITKQKELLISKDNALDPSDDTISSFIITSSSSSSDNNNKSPFRIIDLKAANVHALLFPARTDIAIEAKTYWQHTGEVVSSRRAEVALRLLLKDDDDGKKNSLGGLKHVTSDYYDEEKMQELEEDMEVDEDGWADFEDAGWDICPETMQHYLCLHPASSDDDDDDDGTDGNAFNEYEHIYKGKIFTQQKDGRKKAILDPYQEIKQRIASIISSSGCNNNKINNINKDDGETKKSTTGVVSSSDVFLCPTGMSSIYMALRSARRRRLLSSTEQTKGQGGGGQQGGGTAIVYGFPYLDTLKLCSRPEFVPDGVEFFGHGDAQDLSSLKSHLAKKKEQSGKDDDAGVCALITEFPSNPLLRCPDLYELRNLANQYNFCLIVDDTIGNFANCNLLSSGLADVVCTSLTKLFNGRGDAMAGSIIVNTNTPIGRWMKTDLHDHHPAVVEQGELWKGDAMAIYANSVDFLERSSKINETAELLADWLVDHEDVAMLYYPKYTMDDDESGTEGSSSNKSMYDRVLQDPIPLSATHESYDNFEQQPPPQQQQYHKPGYGGLMSVILHSHVCQRTFFDHLDFPKGPSLGTNFTLSCPYTLLAHYHELDFATSYGVMPNLLRISVGLEDFDVIKTKMEDAFRESKLHPKVPPIRRASPVLSSSSSSSAAGSFSTLAGDNAKRFYSSSFSSRFCAISANNRYVAQRDKVSIKNGLVSPQLPILRSGNIYNKNSWLEFSSRVSGKVRSISTCAAGTAAGSGTTDEIQTYHHQHYVDLSQRFVSILGCVGTRGRRVVSTSSILTRPLLPSVFRFG